MSNGTACCAKFSEDEMWYRAVVLTCDAPNAQVRFLDYGNLDSVDRNSLKAVPKEMLQEPFYCLTCRLKDCTELSEEDLATLLELTADKTISISFLSHAEPYEITLSSLEGEDLISRLGKPAAVPEVKTVDVEQEIKPERSASPSFQVESCTTYRKQIVPKGEKMAYVTHVEESGRFYIQLDDDTTKIESMSEKLIEMAVELEEGNHRHDGVEKDSICCCKYSADGQWYRARVIDKAPPNVHVKFIDYGNEDTSLENEVCSVPKSLQSQPPFGFACCIQGAQLTPHQVGKLREITEGEPVNVIFLTSTEPYDVTMTNSEGSLIQTLLGPGIDHVAAIVDRLVADSLAETSTKDEASPVQGYEELILKEGRREELYVSHADSPDHFWCHPAASEDQLAELMDVLADYCSQLAESERGLVCTPNQACLAKFTQDEGWYRAKVLSVQDAGVEVLFVDYGNSDVSPVVDIVPIKPEHMVLPAQAVQCKLHSKQPVDYNKEAVDQFISITSEKKLLAEVISSQTSDSGVVYSVQLLDMGVDISTQLQVNTEPSSVHEERNESESTSTPVYGSEKEFSQLTDSLQVQVSGSILSLSETAEITEASATSSSEKLSSEFFTLIKMTEGSRVEVTVSHTDSPTHFWLHLKSNSTQLETMMELLSVAMSTTSPDKEPPSVDQPCAALSAEDNTWYRGLVKEIDEALGLIDVFFVDYGLTESVEKDNVRQIPPELMALPVQAVQCGLSEIRFQGTMWNSDAKKRFNDLVLNKTLIASILQVGEEEYCIVQLLDMGMCVAKTMIQEGFGVSTDTPVPTPPHLKRVFTDSPFKEPLKEETESASSGFSTPISVKDVGTGGLPKITLTVGEEKRVSVSHADSPGKFWCHLMSPLPKLEELMAKLQQSYTQTSTPVAPPPLWKIGELCVAQCNEDQQYYRAKIVSLSEDTAEVFYLDFGSTESIPVSGLQAIKGDLLELPAQAVHCSLAQVKPEKSGWEDTSCSRFEEMTYQKELVANVLGFLDDTVLVDLRDDIFSINDSLVQGGYAVQGSSEDPNVAMLGEVSRALNDLESTTVEETTFSKKQRRELPSPINGSEFGEDCAVDLKNITSDVLQLNLTDYINLELDTDSELSVFVCNITDPGNFGIQPVGSSADLESLMADIAECAATEESSLTQDQLKPGFICLAQFSDDDAWYRAKITDIVNDDQFQVLFVDYGNSEVRPASLIRALPDTMLTLPVQYIPCCLADIWADEETWDTDTTSFFRDMCEDKTLNARVSKKENGLYHVYLLDSEDITGWSLNRCLLRKGVQLIPGSELDLELEMEDSLQPELEGSFQDISITFESDMYYGGENESDAEDEKTADVVDREDKEEITVEAEAVNTESNDEQTDEQDKEAPVDSTQKDLCQELAEAEDKTERVIIQDEEDVSGVPQNDWAEADQNQEETKEISATEAEQPEKIPHKEQELNQDAVTVE